MMSAPVSPSTVCLLTVFTACFLWIGTASQQLGRGVKYDISGSRKPEVSDGKLALPVVCYDNYEEQKSYLVCNESGSCEGPHCEPIRCLPPVVWPKKSEPSILGEYVGDHIVFKCLEGRKYVGTNPRICERNGEWSGEMGECILIQCPVLEPPSNGLLIPNPGDAPSHRQFNSTVMVQCEEGYVYPTQPILRCLQNETWNGTIGTCIEKGKPHCEVPVPPTNGYNVPNIQVAEYSEKIKVVCHKGFTFTGSTPRICLENTTWSGIRGTCNVVRCKPFNNVVDGTAAWEWINMNLLAKQRIPGEYVILGESSSLTPVYGDTVEMEVKCPEGQAYNGTSLTCGEHGRWEVSEGSCSVIRCMEHIDIWNGTYNVSGYLYKDTATITCDEGYHWVGNRTHATCSKDGTWKLNGHCWGTQGNARTIVISLVVVLVLALFVIFLCILSRYIKSPSFIQHFWARIEARSTQFVIASRIPTTHRADDMEQFIPLLEQTGSEDPLKDAVLTIGHVTNRNPDKKINLDSQFVKVRLVTGAGYERMNEFNDAPPDHYQDYLERTGAENIEIEDILNHVTYDLTMDRKSKPLLLEGRAGVGKSTLVQKLMRLWAQNVWGKNFKAAFLFNIRNLTVIDKTPMSLVELFRRFSVYTVRGDQGMISQDLLDDDQHLLVFLDGIDEFPGLGETLSYCKVLNRDEKAEPIEWCLNLLQRKVLGKAVLILASRPYEDLKHIKCQPVMEVVGLTKEGVLHFIDHHIAAENIARVRASMESNPLIMSVSAITYFCMMFCKVLEDHQSISTKELITYTRINAFFTKHYMSRCPSDNTFKSQAADLCLPVLAKLAYRGLVERQTMGNRVRLVFDQTDLQETGVTEYIEKIAEFCGILLKSSAGMDGYKESDQYKVNEFVHLSIQELLAMVELLHKTQAVTRSAAAMLWSSGSFLMAQQYLYGLCYDEGSEDIKHLLQVMKNEGEDMGQHKDLIPDLIQRIEKMTDGVDTKTKLQAIQMVYETQREDLAEKVSHVLFDESQELVLTDTLLTVIDINAVIFVLAHTTSECYLRIENITMDSTCGQVLANKIKTCKTLKGLIIRRTKLPEDVMTAIICGLPRGSQFQRLGLDNVGLGKNTNHMQNIKGAVDAMTDLKELSLEGSQWTETGFEDLANSLKKQNTMENLNLAHSGLNEGTLHHLIAVLSITTLNALKLKGNRFTHAIAKWTAPVLGNNQSLQHLNLSDCGIDWPCLEILLAAVNKNAALKTLDVRGEKISKGFMGNLKGNQALEALWCTNADDATVTVLTVPGTERWVQVVAAGNETHITAWCLQDIASSSCLLHTHTVWGHQGGKLILQVDDGYTDLYGGGRPAVSADTWSLTLNQYTSRAHRMDTLSVFLAASASLSPLLSSLTPATIASLTHKLRRIEVYYGEVSCTELIFWLSSITTQPGWTVIPHTQGAEITTSHSHTLVILLWYTRVRASLQQQQQHLEDGINLLEQPKWVIE